MQELDKILKDIELEKKRISLSRDCSNEYAVTEISLLEKIEKIIRKHMNDGWISCNERMPTKEECENDYFWIMLKYNTSPVIAKCSWVESEDETGNDDSFSEFYIDQYPQMYTPSKNIVIAWRIAEVPESYRPERRDNHERE